MTEDTKLPTPAIHGRRQHLGGRNGSKPSLRVCGWSQMYCSIWPVSHLVHEF
jgi:hypothetical protein